MTRPLNPPNNSFIRATLSIVLALAFLLGRPVLADSPEVTTGDAVVMLINSGQDVCATGFFIDANRLVTAYHVAEALCPATECFGTQILAKSQPLKDTILKASLLLPAYDLAVFEVQPPWTGPLLRLVPLGATERLKDQQDASQAISVISFPQCKSQQAVEGTLQLGHSFGFTNAKVKHGSSGGPVLTKSGAVVGLVSEASSMEDALLSIFVGSSFSQAKIALSNPLQIARDMKGKELLDLQADALITEYLSQILPQSGIMRYQRAASFLNRVRALSLQASSEQALLENSIRDLPPFDQLGLLKRTTGKFSSAPLATLYLLASLERFGASSRPLKLNPKGTFSSFARALPPSSAFFSLDTEHIIQTAEEMEISSYRGSELGFILWCLRLGGFLLIAGMVVAALLVVGFIRYQNRKKRT